MIGARFIVRGKVQGVWFRAATREQALQLDITGSARNRDDGSVEVDAFGSAEAIARLQAWLAIGPPLALVSEVTWQPLDAAPPRGFATG